MATTSAVHMLLPAAAAVLMVMMVLQLSATAAAAPPQAPIRLPNNCSTTCGVVSVPYPFGFGPSHCYWPGLNLTCDRSYDIPRLLLGDGTFQVTDIFLQNATVRVMRTGPIINATGDIISDGWNASFGRGFTDHGYLLSYKNELVVFECNVTATLLADVGEDARIIIGGCASICSIWSNVNIAGYYDDPAIEEAEEAMNSNRKYCTGIGISRWCCQASLLATSMPRELQARWLYTGNHTTRQKHASMNMFVAEEGWLDQNGQPDDHLGVPLVLGWRVTQGLPQCHYVDSNCNEGVGSMLCKSEHSYFLVYSNPAGYTCHCKDGYEGNAYLDGGCQDIDECKLPSEDNGCLFGACINTIGSMECRCPYGTYGDPGVNGGCIKSNTTADPLFAMEASTQVGLPNCSNTCGNMRVPYPFGISPGCYWPGFKLICDTSDDHPRLLLDSSSILEVVDISLPDSMVRVTHHTSTVYDTANFNEITSGDFLLLDISETYMLSSRNEIILFGCDVQATLHGEDANGSSSKTSDSIISQCISTCSSSGDGYAGGPHVPTQTQSTNCTGHDGCCHAPFSAGSKPTKVNMKLLNLSISQYSSPFVLISEGGLTDQWYNMISKWITEQSIPGFITYPLVLEWAVKQDVPAPTDNNSGKCPEDTARRICKSQHSDCRQENGGFTCYCSTDYHGNPYVANGCRDMCNIMAQGNPCYGDCNNLPGGHFICQCPRGTHGNPFQPGGCVKSTPGLIIGLSIASGPTLLLLVLVTILIFRKIKQRRIQLLKKKYFMQNRGQLLQQLVSQKADIAERMIISVDELAKATNNFDKARELGGGGHGTVYKGILSDLHVVAIKKSKIAVQKEIDEFINEVAILSQINHRNVVKLFGCCLETEVPLLVYEFISNGTLYHHLHVEGPRSLSWGNRLRIATEIATSIAYLHSAVSIPIIHRDIKSSNILLDDTLTSKVSDFGASRYIPIEKTGLTTGVQGTIGYLDPMYFYTSRLTEKSDVYSFGVILVELLSRKKPFSYFSEEGTGLVAHFVDLLSEGNLVQIIDPQVIEEGGEEVQEVAALAASCVDIRAEQRPTMRQVEHSLEGLWGTRKYKKDDTVQEECVNQAGGQPIQESGRKYSLEQEMMLSSKYPR